MMKTIEGLLDQLDTIATDPKHYKRTGDQAFTLNGYDYTLGPKDSLWLKGICCLAEKVHQIKTELSLMLPQRSFTMKTIRTLINELEKVVLKEDRYQRIGINQFIFEGNHYTLLPNDALNLEGLPCTAEEIGCLAAYLESIIRVNKIIKIRTLVDKLNDVCYDEEFDLRDADHFVLQGDRYHIWSSGTIKRNDYELDEPELAELIEKFEYLIFLYTAGSFAALVQQAADEKAAETSEMLATSYKKQETALIAKLAKQFSWENPKLCLFDGLAAFRFDGHIISVTRSRYHGTAIWDWIVWGACPKCGAEGWSQGDINAHWIGKMLADFRMDCPDCAIALQETLKIEASSLPNRLVEIIKEVVLELLDEAGVDYE